MTKDAGPTITVALDAGVSIRNRLPEGHRYRLTLDRALRFWLRDLSGRWDVSVHAVGRILVQVDVVAPGGSQWSIAVPVPEGPRAEDVADTIRAACIRLRWPEPALGEPECRPLRRAQEIGEHSACQPALPERA